MSKNHEDIRISCEAGIADLEECDEYQKAVKCYQTILSFNDVVSHGSQIQRAAESVVLNIAEGRGRGYQGSRVQFYMTSRGSAWEVYAALQIGPRHLRDAALPAIKETILALEEAVMNMV